MRGLKESVPLFGVLNGIGEAGLKCAGSVLSILGESHKTSLVQGRIFAAVAQLLENSLGNLPAGFFGIQTSAHSFHNQEGAAGTYNFFAVTARCNRPYFGINIQTATNERGIPHPSVHFVGHATGGANPGQAALGIQSYKAHGIVIFDIHPGLIT
jgi:hypothetical protein